MKETEAESVLKSASGQPDLESAVAWFGEGHQAVVAVSPQRIMDALVSCAGGVSAEAVTAALRKVLSRAAASSLDTGSVLFDTSTVTRPARFGELLDLLASKNPSGGLVGISAAHVRAAATEDPGCMDTLALIAGLTPKELRRRAGLSDSGVWSPRQVTQAFDIVNLIVEGTGVSTMPGAVPHRPIEHLFNSDKSIKGWALVEQMRTDGVPLGTLLAQRAVGSAWGLHRNATSSRLGMALTSKVCDELTKLGTDFDRSRTSGGDKDLSGLSTLGKATDVVTKDATGAPMWFVVVSVANDSGTASKTAARLRDGVAPGQTALLLAGSGWSERINEIAELARLVAGNVFSERDAHLLAQRVSVAP